MYNAYNRFSGKNERNIVVNRAFKTKDKPKQILVELIMIFVSVLEDTNLNRESNGRRGFKLPTS